MASRGFALAVATLAVGFGLGTAVQTQDNGPDEARIVQIRRAAEQGDADAEFELGVLYALGTVVRQDAAQAVRWFRRASEEGHALANGLLGSSAKLVEANQELVSSLRRSAEQGHATAKALLGRIGVLQDDPDAEMWVRRAAAQGNAWGSYYLGLMHYQGQGVREDTAEAIRLWKQAADRGLSLGASEIGSLHLLGIVVEENEAESARWYRRAAQLGSVDTNLLGAVEVADVCGSAESAVPSVTLLRRFWEGVNDRADWAEMNRSAEQGDVDARLFLGGLPLERRLRTSPEDAAKAVRWFRPAADQGDTLAQYYLGIAYDAGKGVGEDDAEAARWFRCAERTWRLAAARGDANAQYLLGGMYMNGNAVLKNYVEAERWYRMAATGGHVLAQSQLGLLYGLGWPHEGIPQSWPEAERWYRMAAEQGHSPSQYELGNMYAWGFRGVERDVVEAARWWRRAAEQGHQPAQRRLDSVDQ